MLRQKAQNRDITHFCDKTAYNLAQILPELGKKLHQHCWHAGTFFHICVTTVTTVATVTTVTTVTTGTTVTPVTTVTTVG